MIRVAAVDLGTNSTRLLVADVEDGRLAEVHRETTITRLGEGVDEGRRLLPAPVARVRDALSDFRRTIERLGAERTLAIATSAVRDAENGETFLNGIERSFGFATRLLSGDEEALLTRRGVASGRGLDAGTLIVDIGGGSTELILDDFHVSLDVGSVRLTERFLHSDPPTGAELAGAGRAVRNLLPDLTPAAAVGVAGTVTTLAALAARPLSRETIAAQLDRLARLTIDERRKLAAMDPERAPVIVGGAVILDEVARGYRLPDVEVSERDILDGAALLAADVYADRLGQRLRRIRGKERVMADQEEIARRAYEISQSEESGSDEENWRRAERELGAGESSGEPWAKTSSGNADSITES